ncbi:protease [Roseomonas sp. M0104]|uniref:Protease n=2 Tax=Teichococcus coralli TaxID=2545983 RepID=A0A845BLM6_9PROT|nr:protease [Pseudoroseomonas coralli]
MPLPPLPNPVGPPPDTVLSVSEPLPPRPNPFGPRPSGPLSSLSPYENHPLHTGRKLVLMARGGTRAAMATLSGKAGLRVHAADRGAVAAAAVPAGPSSLPAEEALVFEDLGIAVVNASPDQAVRLQSLALEEESLDGVEWERFVFALGPSSRDFLLGYRAGVDRLVEEMLSAEGAGAGTGAEAAVTAARFQDASRLTWGMRATRADASRYSGKGIAVAVLDTGIDLSHPDFVGRVLASESFVDGEEVQDGQGHGTHCAGVVCGPRTPSRLPRYGVAPDALLHVGKVLGNDGVGTDTSILGGIEWALGKKCAIISMSLGAPVAKGAPRSPAFEQVGRRALDAGTLIVAAAGNDSRRPGRVAPVSHPANCRTFVAVGALDPNLSVAWFSNAGLDPDGGQVDIAGPGVDIRSAWPLAETYRLESGTSMATPHVAGVAALLAESDPSLRGHALANRLYQKARRLPISAVDTGTGLVQAP